MQPRRLGTAIPCGNADRNIFECDFRVFHENVEVAILREHPGINQLVLGLVPRADTCREIADRNWWASRPDSSNTLLRPRRDSLPRWSDRKAAPSGCDLFRSTLPGRNRCAGG